MIDVRDLVGLPYQLGGAGLEGYDCYELLRECYRRRGVQLPQFKTAGGNSANAVVMRENIASNWRQVERGPDRAIWFRVLGWECHVGYAIDEFRFIHAIEGCGVAIERIDQWSRRIIDFYDYTPHSPHDTISHE